MSKTIKKIKIDNFSHTKNLKKAGKTLYLPNDREVRMGGKAKNRGFLPGYVLEDWLEAENQI